MDSPKEKIEACSVGPDVSEFARLALRKSELVYSPETLSGFRRVADRPPGMINIDVSTLCNLKCGMCPLWSDQQAGRLKKKILDFDLFVKIIDEVAALTPRAVISLTPRGELFCHPRAMDIIREIKKRNLYLCFVTNGTLFGPEEIEEMINLRVDEIRFSVDALFPETYKSIRGADKHGAVVGNIWEILHRRKGGVAVTVPHVNLNFVLQAHNAKELFPFIAYWGDKVNEIQINKLDTDDVSPLNIKEINRKFHKPPRYICLAPWRDVYIGSEGYVYPCCYDPFVTMKMGNLREKSLQEIWLDEPYMRLREEMLRGEFDEFAQCRNCDNWNLSPKYSFETIHGNLFDFTEYFDSYRYKFLKKYPLKAFDIREYKLAARRLLSEYLSEILHK